MRPHLTVEQRQLALRLRARGLTVGEIGPQVLFGLAGTVRVPRMGPRHSP